MPVWAAILITVGGFLITAGTFFGFGTYFATLAKRRAEKKIEHQDKLDELEQKDDMNKLVSALMEQLKPLITESVNAAVKEAVAPMENDLKLLKAGVQDGCRNDLEQIVEKADSQKWLSRYDKDRFEHTYDSYHNLGKNGIMDSSRERILKLPERPPAKKSKK